MTKRHDSFRSQRLRGIQKEKMHVQLHHTASGHAAAHRNALLADGAAPDLGASSSERCLAASVRPGAARIFAVLASLSDHQLQGHRPDADATWRTSPASPATRIPRSSSNAGLQERRQNSRARRLRSMNCGVC